MQAIAIQHSIVAVCIIHSSAINFNPLKHRVTIPGYRLNGYAFKKITKGKKCKNKRSVCACKESIVFTSFFPRKPRNKLLWQVFWLKAQLIAFPFCVCRTVAL
jgi:hypothetical protein